tara:strand:+ start:2595 stop:2759 length:165 start_codon:yes stop_codon:yes gene_type:complete
MNGRMAKRIRDLIGYDKKNPNPIQKRLYKKLKEQYASLGPEAFWKRVEGRFNSN